MGINSLAGLFFEITDAVFSFTKRHAHSVVLFARICAFVFFARVHNAGSVFFLDDGLKKSVDTR